MFVACKVPNGLQIRGAGKECVLLGPNKAPLLPEPNPAKLRELFGGYAVTAGVDDDLWAAWFKASADQEVVKNKLVFAEENLEVLKARAFGRAKIKSGLEQAIPNRS